MGPIIIPASSPRSAGTSLGSQFAQRLTLAATVYSTPAPITATDKFLTLVGVRGLTVLVALVPLFPALTSFTHLCLRKVPAAVIVSNFPQSGHALFPGVESSTLIASSTVLTSSPLYSDISFYRTACVALPFSPAQHFFPAPQIGRE